MPTEASVVVPHHGAGHRARLRERFERSGLQGFSEHEILELLLTLCIPRRDVKLPAKALLERFGSLRATLDASLDALREVEGLGSVAPVALRIIRDASTLYLQQSAEEERTLLNGTQRLVDFWTARLGDLPIEVFEVAYLDPEYRLLKDGVERVQQGDLSETVVYPRTILASALKRNAAGIVLAHNHPTGRAEPSAQDCELTKHLAQASVALGIQMVDHLIVSSSGTFSFRRSGLLRS